MPKATLIFLFIVTFSLVSTAAFGQAARSFQHIGEEDGLVGNSVISTALDQDGFVWAQFVGDEGSEGIWGNPPHVDFSSLFWR